MDARGPPLHGVGDFVRGYEAERRLRGFRCRACGFRTASWGIACARCGKAELEEAELGTTGAVVARTIVVVPTEERVNDAPYAYVLVDLDGGGRISGWMAGVRSEAEVPLGRRVRFRPGYRTGIEFEPEPEGRG